MIQIESIEELSTLLDSERAAGRTIGLVPTMGALHAGHISLIERASRECDRIVVSIFVNPLQFDEGSDLDAYPRTLDVDRAMAESFGAHILFAPSVKTMYPEFPEQVLTRVHVDRLGDGLEGGNRPGHFDGVATVVTKLFAIAGRCRAYFGEKDFQQLALVRRLAADLSFPVEIVGCPVVRDSDGLALSSRNSRLTPDQRRSAAVLYRALSAGRAAISDGQSDPWVVKATMEVAVATEPLAQLAYAEVVDAETLRVPDEISGECRLLIAARVGDVRLIDNLKAVVAQSVQRGDDGTLAQGRIVAYGRQGPEVHPQVPRLSVYNPTAHDPASVFDPSPAAASPTNGSAEPQFEEPQFEEPRFEEAHLQEPQPVLAEQPVEDQPVQAQPPSAPAVAQPQLPEDAGAALSAVTNQVAASVAEVAALAAQLADSAAPVSGRPRGIGEAVPLDLPADDESHPALPLRKGQDRIFGVSRKPRLSVLSDLSDMFGPSELSEIPELSQFVITSRGEAPSTMSRER